MRRACMMFALVLSVSCRTVTLPPPQPQTDYTLKVAIYPVANAQTIAARVKAEFEQAYPQYDVVVTVADSTGLYDPATLAGWLADGTYDLVEADMILLETVRDKLAQSGKSLPVWTNPPYYASWTPALAAASTLDGSVYGVPHYGCGYFLFTTDKALADQSTSTDFFNALTAVGDKKTYLIAMNVDGSVTTGAVYLNGWSSQYGNLTGALTPPYDNQAVIATMKKLTTACLPNQSGSDSPCLSGAFRDNADRQTFIDGKANTFVGFSESLQPIRQAAPSTTYYIRPAPLGVAQPLLAYTDSLLRRTDCTYGPCAAAVSAFAEYYLRPSTYAWLLMGQDIPNNQVPRYLIPATVTGWPRRGTDSYYDQIHAAATNVAAFPNRTFYAVRSDMRAQIKPQITP